MIYAIYLSSYLLIIVLLVCKIPKPSILSCQTGSISNLLEDNEIGGGVGLALTIMFELQMKEKSPWFDYLESLPEFEPLPLFWNEKQLETLKGTRVLTTLIKLMEDLKEDYESIVVPFIQENSEIVDEAYFNYDTYTKVTSWISSRAFDVDNFHGRSMVPLADLFNHHITAENVHIECDDDVCPYCGSNGTCAHYDQLEDLDDEEPLPTDEIFRDYEIPLLLDLDEPEKSSSDKLKEKEDKDEEEMNDYMMEMRVVKAAKKGEEVFNTYGENLSNDYLLTRYGYSEPNNPFDIIYFNLQKLGQSVCKLSKLKPEVVEERIGKFLNWSPHLLPLIAPHLIPKDDESEAEDEDEMGDEDEEGDDEDDMDDYDMEINTSDLESVNSDEIVEDELNEDDSEMDSQSEHSHPEDDEEHDDDDDEINALIEKIKYGIDADGHFSKSLICLLHAIYSEEFILDTTEDPEELLHHFSNIIDNFPLTKAQDAEPSKKKRKSTLSKEHKNSIQLVKYLLEEDLKELNISPKLEKEFEELKSKVI